jgi:hypothetical protein
LGAVRGLVIALVITELADLPGLRVNAVAGVLCDQPQHVDSTPWSKRNLS